MSPAKTRFRSLVLAFICLLNNRAEIDYLYVDKPRMSNESYMLKPLWQDWGVAKMTIETSKGLVGSTILNQVRGDIRLLSDAMDNFINV